LDDGKWPSLTSTNQKYGALGDGSGLGAIDCLSNSNLNYAYTIGKMEAKAILQPPSIQNLVTNGSWDMKRWRSIAAWDNGQSASPDAGDDTSPSDLKFLNPAKGDIFDLDTPGCSIFFGTRIQRTAEVYDNFYQYVTVRLGGRETLCSDFRMWSYTAQVDVDNPTNKVQLNSIQSSLINLPTQPHYPQR
jgi:hypothetical protein